MGGDSVSPPKRTILGSSAGKSSLSPGGTGRFQVFFFQVLMVITCSITIANCKNSLEVSQTSKMTHGLCGLHISCNMFKTMIYVISSLIQEGCIPDCNMHTGGHQTCMFTVFLSDPLDVTFALRGSGLKFCYLPFGNQTWQGEIFMENLPVGNRPLACLTTKGHTRFHEHENLQGLCGLHMRCESQLERIEKLKSDGFHGAVGLLIEHGSSVHSPNIKLESHFQQIQLHFAMQRILYLY